MPKSKNEPKPKEPKVEEPKVEEPKPKEPKVEEPKVSKLDHKRVRRWAELLKADPEAAELFVEELIGPQLKELRNEISSGKTATAKYQMMAKYKVPEDQQHLITATDAEGMEKQAKSVSELLSAVPQEDKPKEEDKEKLPKYDPDSGITKEQFDEREFIKAYDAENSD